MTWGGDNQRHSDVQNKRKLKDTLRQPMNVPQTPLLLKEAQKYKSAEEFVNAQPTAYHITNADTKITKWSTKKSFGRVWFTDKKEALHNVGASGKGKIYQVYFPEGNWATPEQADDSFTDRLISDGFDGVYHPDKSGEYGNYYEVFNVDVIKSKAQLEKIWKEANGKGVKK